MQEFSVVERDQLTESQSPNMSQKIETQLFFSHRKCEYLTFFGQLSGYSNLVKFDFAHHVGVLNLASRN